MAAPAQIAALLAEYEPAVERAFLDAMQALRSGADLARLVAALEVGDIEGALDALNLKPAALQRFEMTVAQAYQAAGAAAAPVALPKTAPRLVFDMRNPGAEEFLRHLSSDKITAITEEQRRLARDVLQDGLSKGHNPKTTALDLVGRINRVTGLREGGVIGLTNPQAQVIDNLRGGLMRGDPEALRYYLGLTRKDARSARIVARALKEGRPISAADRDMLLKRLGNSYLQLRGETVARTETITAVSSAQHEALAQAVQASGVDEAQLERTWISTHGPRTRHSHAVMKVKKVRGLDTPFVTGDGSRLRYPGDRKFGAPASAIINCRCAVSHRLVAPR